MLFEKKSSIQRAFYWWWSPVQGQRRQQRKNLSNSQRVIRELSWWERYAGFELEARCRTRLNHLESVFTLHNTLLLAVHKQESYQKLSAISILTLRSTINSSQQSLCQRENLNILIPHNERTAAAAAYYVVSDLLSQNGHVDKHWPTFTFFISDLIHWKQLPKKLYQSTADKSETIVWLLIKRLWV